MTASNERRTRRELRTVGAMIALFCRGHHGTDHGLCAECQELWEYAQQRVERCPLCDDKPTCLNCPVHCYRPAMRERIRTVMRYSGPRMMRRHPLLAILHLLSGRRDLSRASVQRRSRAPNTRAG